MISLETASKAKHEDEISALQAMKTIARFCLDQEDCAGCPFYNKELYIDHVSEFQCMLSRTNNFTPADWNVEMLVN